MVTRTASRVAFAAKGRSLVTADIIPGVGSAFAEVFGKDAETGNLGKL